MGNSESKRSGDTSRTGEIAEEQTRICYEKQLCVADTLLELASSLDELDGNFEKANIAIASVSVALTATGIGLSFFTFGSSLVLTAVGAGLVAATGVSGIASSGIEKFLKTKKVKEANKAIQKYAKAVIEYAPLLQKFCDSLATEEERERFHAVLTDSSAPRESVTFRYVSDQRDACEVCSKGHSIVMTSHRVQEVLQMPAVGGGTSGAATKFILNLVSEASSLAEKSLSNLSPLAKGISIGSHALAGVGLIIDIGTIIHQSLKIHKKKPSEVAQLLRAVAGAFMES